MFGALLTEQIKNVNAPFVKIFSCNIKISVKYCRKYITEYLRFNIFCEISGFLCNKNICIICISLYFIAVLNVRGKMGYIKI